MPTAIEQITKEAKKIRAANKNISWREAIKKASKKYNAGAIGKAKTKKDYHQTGKSYINYDRFFKAKPPGKRKSKSGNIYYERRKNRSDVPGKLTGLGAILKYFSGNQITDIDALKKIYFQKAKQYHPDAGGTKEAFQEMKAEYEMLLKRLLSGSNLSAEEIKTELDLDDALRAAATAIVGLPGITVELVGKWLWVSGNTYPIRNELKAAGFQFAPIKKVWYYKGVESAGRGNLTLDEIRSKYGSEIIKEEMKKLQGIGLTLSAAKRRKFYLNIKKATRLLNNRTEKKINGISILKKTF